MRVRDELPVEAVEGVEVDVTLIDAALRMTPVERLRLNDRMATLVAKLRDAFDRKDRWKSPER
jgi:hypothetical protein